MNYAEGAIFVGHRHVCTRDDIVYLRMGKITFQCTYAWTLPVRSGVRNNRPGWDSTSTVYPITFLSFKMGSIPVWSAENQPRLDNTASCPGLYRSAASLRIVTQQAKEGTNYDAKSAKHSSIPVYPVAINEKKPTGWGTYVIRLYVSSTVCGSWIVHDVLYICGSL